MGNTDRKGLRNFAVRLGLKADGPSVVRSELPILASPNYPISATTLSRTSTEAISPDRAMSLAAVYRAVFILAGAVSQLPLGVWRNGEELPELDQTFPGIVKRPNLDLSRSAFLEQTTTSLAVSGNAYWLLEGKTSKAGRASNLVVLNPHAVTITYDNGQKFFQVGDKKFPDWKVKHLMLARIPGFDVGLGPIQTAQNELRGSLDLRNYSDNWFKDGGVPSGILKNSQQMSPKEAANAKDAFDTNQSTKGRGVVVLAGDWSYQPVYLSPADAQFLESRQFDVTQVARLFGIPATYMLAGVEGNSTTYTNLEMVDTQFVKYTLMKYLREIEEALTDLTVRGQEVRFKVDALLRPDTLNRYKAHQIAVGGQPFLDVDEVRELEGRLPLTPAQKAAMKPAPAPVQQINNQGETA